jgi:diacylglycerol kinase family enzyme
VAAGGDGTVSDLVNRHPGIAIAILPLGTENLLARYIKQSCCGRTLAENIHRGHLRTLDSAKANGLRFLLMLSVGVDAEVVDAVHSRRVGNIHRLSYAWPCLRAFFSSRPVMYTATSADGTVALSGSHIIVTNVPVYGFGLPFAPHAQPDDQQLDVRVFQGKTRWAIFCHAVRLKLGLPLRDGEVSRFSDRAVSISAELLETRKHAQCDGDPGPSLPVLIEIEPQSLRLIVP